MGRVSQKSKKTSFPLEEIKTPGFALEPQRDISTRPRGQNGKWLSVYLPRLTLEVQSGGAEFLDPFAVVDGKAKNRLLIFNQHAKEKGLQVGMPLSAAFALATDLRVKERDEFAEKSALEALAGWATQFTSFVAVEPPQALLMEIGGSEKLFGGMTLLVHSIEQGLKQLGYESRMAIAPTPLAALLLSRSGSRNRSWTHSITGDLAKVPLEYSGLEEKVVQTLFSLGLRTFADFYRLPRDGLARRVGPQVVMFLDKVLGNISDPRSPYVVPKSFKRCLSLPEEVAGSRALLFALRRPLLELTGILRASDTGIQMLSIDLYHRKHSPTHIEISLLSPSRDGEQLQLLIKERLELIALPNPVEGIEFKAGKFLPLAPDALDFFKTSRRVCEQWSGLIEKLRIRLGRGAVYCLDTVCEYRPERAWEINNLKEPGFSKRHKRQVKKKLSLPRGEKVSASLGELHAPWLTLPQAKEGFSTRPVWLLAEPELLCTRNHRPYLRGSLHLSHPCERIESGWWDGNDVSRDYFIALNKVGECYWIFRDRRSPEAWYLHGIFS